MHQTKSAVAQRSKPAGAFVLGVLVLALNIAMLIGAERYFPTRGAAVEWLAGCLAAERAAGRRVLVGFDFPFGYPAGFAEAVTGEPRALALWAHLASLLRDDPATNANNRFEVAAALNAARPGPGPFWGNGLAQELPDRGASIAPLPF